MSENIYAATTTINESNHEKRYDRQYFYVVSKKKFLLLFILTYGLYAPYWVYRQWQQYQGATMEAIRPVSRGIFFIFFLTSLAERIKEHLNDAQLAAVGNIKNHASSLVTVVVGNKLLQISAEKGLQISEMVLLLCEFGSVLGAAFIGWQIQRAANLAEADPDGNRNAEFSGANSLWLTLGAIFWIFVLIGTVMTVRE